MSVLTRLSGALLMAGLVVGLVLRLVLTRGRLRTLVGLALVPLPLHMAVVALAAVKHGATLLGLGLYLVGGAAVGVAGWLIGRRGVPHRAWLAALMPSLVALVYGLLPFALYSWRLRTAGIDLDIIPTAVYLGATLFATGALLVFVPAPPAGPGRGLLRRRR